MGNINQIMYMDCDKFNTSKKHKLEYITCQNCKKPICIVNYHCDIYNNKKCKKIKNTKQCKRCMFVNV